MSIKLFGKIGPFRRIVAALVLTAFVLTSVPVQAQVQPWMPGPGSLVPLSSALPVAVLQGVKVYLDKPFQLDFILGQTEHAGKDMGRESQELVKYFLAGLTIPEKDLWVNLSPYEQDRIIPDGFGQTGTGRVLLEQDYLLKQLTASLLHPDSATGRQFWSRVYQKAHERFGTTEIPVETFHKVWIVPDKADVYEKKNSDPGEAVAYILDARLKVMLEADYLATANNASRLPTYQPLNVKATRVAALMPDTTGDLSTAVMREVIIPVLEKEVNEGANFAPLRQVYHALILAAWYKQKVRDSVLSRVYVDRSKVVGVNIDETGMADRVWKQYVAAFRKGAVDLVREEKDVFSDDVLPRRYFSGGVDASELSKALNIVDHAVIPDDASGVVVALGLDPVESQLPQNDPYLRGLWEYFPERVKAHLAGTNILELGVALETLSGLLALKKAGAKVTGAGFFYETGQEDTPEARASVTQRIKALQDAGAFTGEELQQKAYQDLELPENAYDVIYARFSLYENDKALYRNIFKALKPGGRLIMARSLFEPGLTGAMGESIGFIAEEHEDLMALRFAGGQEIRAEARVVVLTKPDAAQNLRGDGQPRISAGDRVPEYLPRWKRTQIRVYQHVFALAFKLGREVLAEKWAVKWARVSGEGDAFLDFYRYFSGKVRSQGLPDLPVVLYPGIGTDVLSPFILLNADKVIGVDPAIAGTAINDLLIRIYALGGRKAVVTDKLKQGGPLEIKFLFEGRERLSVLYQGRIEGFNTSDIGGYNIVFTRNLSARVGDGPLRPFVDNLPPGGVAFLPADPRPGAFNGMKQIADLTHPVHFLWNMGVVLKRDAVAAPDKTGGIDLTAGRMDVRVQGQGGDIRFNIDPARLAELEKSAGFSPRVVSIDLSGSVSAFLGLKASR